MTWRPRPELRLTLEVEQSPSRQKYVCELMSEIRAQVFRGMKPGSSELSKLFRYMAEHVHGARLQNGSRLCDAGDFAEWLRELAREAKL